VGCAVLDAETGELRGLGRLAVHSASLDFWRAPTDNDVLTAGGPVAGAWRRAGLDRLQQRIIAVQRGEDELRTRHPHGACRRLHPQVLHGEQRGPESLARWIAGGGGQ
jgi:beta-galactosidase